MSINQAQRRQTAAELLALRSSLPVTDAVGWFGTWDVPDVAGL